MLTWKTLRIAPRAAGSLFYLQIWLNWAQSLTQKCQSDWLTARLVAALSKHFVVTFFYQSLHTKRGTRRQWQQHVASQSVSYILSLWFHHGQRRRVSIQQISPVISDKERGRSLQLSRHVMWAGRPRQRGWDGAWDALEQNAGLIFWRGLLCFAMYY